MTPADFPSSPLNVGVFLLLRDLIQERLGVWYEEDKRDLLASKLVDRIAALQLRSPLEYYYRLRYGPGAEDEWPLLSDALSVQETYFWREIDQVRALVELLLPQYAAASPGPIQIWSAACATGEEPLTLAIALSEAGWFERAPIAIWASDVSPAALDRATRGVYRARSFRALPEDLKAKYFTPVEGGWRVDPALQARIRYRRANLLDAGETAPFDAAPFIFCRNVFIYFSAATVAEVVARFGARMPTPGYLFVGVSESLLRLTTTFSLEQVGDAYVYVKT